MDIQKGKEIFKKFRIILDIGFSSTTIMGRVIKKISPKKVAVMQWNMQAGKITTNQKVKIDFTLPELSAKQTESKCCRVST